jgi:hypothetical protein
MLVWDAADAAPILDRWAQWAPGAPDNVTTAFRILSVPPIPEMPEPFRGRTIVVIDGAVLAGPDEAAKVLAPLTELRPEMSTFDVVPAHTLSRLHMDPEGPTPTVSSSVMLRELPDAGVDAVLTAAGPGSGSSLMLAAELRQLGGALARQRLGAGALGRLDAQYTFFCGTLALDDEAASSGIADAARTVRALEPWTSGHYLNLTEQAVDPSTAYSPDAWERLRAVRAAVDPDGLFLANHPVPGSAAVPRQR